MKQVKTSALIRQRRHRRLRQGLRGTALRPRLAVWRSLLHISAQLIDDASQTTLLAVSDKSLKLGAKVTPQLAAAKVGAAVAAAATAQKIKQVVFDRGGYAYHGRVKALAEAARAAGLEF